MIPELAYTFPKFQLTPMGENRASTDLTSLSPHTVVVTLVQRHCNRLFPSVYSIPVCLVCVVKKRLSIHPNGRVFLIASTSDRKQREAFLQWRNLYCHTTERSRTLGDPKLERYQVRKIWLGVQNLTLLEGGLIFSITPLHFCVYFISLNKAEVAEGSKPREQDRRCRGTNLSSAANEDLSCIEGMMSVKSAEDQRI
ncbi:hypothetical protein TNCV_1002341 [Trichonephila clavipes]|nr:hypothetical protein TNCV_1002341 [Trichonephila clavipes]